MFGLLFLHLFLKFRSSRLKLLQSLLEVRHFLLDLAQLRSVLAARQTIRAQFFSDVLLKLTPQESEIWISPYCPLSVLEFAGSYAPDNEVPVYSIFLLRRYVAQGCPFAIPLTVFCHFLSL